MPDRVPLKEVVEAVPAVSQKAEERLEPPTSPVGFMDDLNYHRVSDFLGISYEDRKNSRLAEKVSLLFEWGEKTSNSKDRIDALMAIKDLQKRLGIQVVGKEAIQKLWQWVRLDTDRQRIEKEMEAV